MSEVFPGPNEALPEPKKIPIRERISTSELADKFSELEEYARYIEDRLFTAYGSIPGKGQVHDAAERVMEDLISVAKDARQFAKQYRGFNVGAVVLGLRKTERPDQNPWTVMFDANTKMSKEEPKWCAEQYLMDRAESAAEALDKILSFVVVAEPQTDDDSKVTQITLTPCKLCRDRMHAMTGQERPMMNEETEIVTAHANQTAFRKIQKFKDLWAFHNPGAPRTEWKEVD